ncbi:XisI protein [Microcoleus sp. D3_18a_C4]|uniref:XisI protein n=1 Tax=unclassified Microcoleus TaxID=2642155 RepID=UPI002FD5EE2D
MANLDSYRNAVQQALLNYAQMRSGTSSNSELELQILFDPQRDHYQLVYVGWYKSKRVYGPILHLDIKDEKIWLQLNTTADDITLDLMELGIAKDDIVLGFHAPYMRQFTEFAVG